MLLPPTGSELTDLSIVKRPALQCFEQYFAPFDFSSVSCFLLAALSCLILALETHRSRSPLAHFLPSQPPVTAAATAPTSPMHPVDGRPSTVGRDDSVTRGSSSFSGDPEKGGIEDPHPLSAHASSRKSSKFTPWRKYNSLNPLRWRQPPPVPDKRQISKEADAGIWSKATLSWMGDLMKVRRCPQTSCVVYRLTPYPRMS